MACSCAPIFNFFVDPHNLSLGTNLYQKLWFFAIFVAVGPHFLSQNGKIWHEGADLRLPSPSKFYKNCLRGYTRFGQIYTKNYQFRRRAWEFLPMPNFVLKNRLMGYTPLGQIYTIITNFGDFGTCKPTFWKPQLWSLAWGYGRGTPSPAPNFGEKNSKNRPRCLPVLHCLRGDAYWFLVKINVTAVCIQLKMVWACFEKGWGWLGKMF